MAQCTGVIVEVVRAGDLYAARAEVAFNETIGDDGNLAVAQRQIDGFPDELGIAFIVGMHRQRAVGHHGFRARGGDVHAAHAVNRAVAERVEDVPHEAVMLMAFNLQIAHRALEHRVPVHQPLAAVDQPLLVKLDEGLHHGLGQLLVHGEVLVRPAHRVAHAAHLAGDGVARLLLPFPHFFDELAAPQVVAALARGLQLPLHHDLRGNARMVHARHPQRVVAPHAVVAHQGVHHGLVERMAHVQRARDVGRRQLHAERRFGGVQRGSEHAQFFPALRPVGFDVVGLKRFGEFGHGNGQGAATCCGSEARRRAQQTERP